MDYALKFLVICSLATSIFGYSASSDYVGTVHHSPEHLPFKRAEQESQFAGKLIYNNTLNEDGEATISICDISNDLFSSLPSSVLFDYDTSVGVNNLAEANLKAKFQANLKIEGCLVFFFNPCCKTFGLRLRLNEPVVLAATGSLQVNLKAFSFGTTAGSNNINLNPLNNLDISGISPVIGSWSLPPIMDNALKIAKNGYCAPLGVPGISASLKFCVLLNNFTAVANGVNVCPRLTISFGNQNLFDVSYTALVPKGANQSECLTLPFLPMCSYQGNPVSPNIVQIFKSADANSDQKVTPQEMLQAKALLGVSPDSHSNGFSQMDVDEDGELTFGEFQRYAVKQESAFNNSAISGGKVNERSFSKGEIAAAVIVTMVGTAFLVAAILIGVAQYKGIINVGWLPKKK